MARLDLTDDERDELVGALRGIIEANRFPLPPRVRCLRRILDKLETPGLVAGAGPASQAARRAHATATLNWCALTGSVTAPER